MLEPLVRLPLTAPLPLSLPRQAGEPRLSALPPSSTSVGAPSVMVRHDGFFRWGRVYGLGARMARDPPRPQPLGAHAHVGAPRSRSPAPPHTFDASTPARPPPCRHDRFWHGAGIAAPVFSLRSRHSVGMGEFLDLMLLVDLAHRWGRGRGRPRPHSGSTSCPRPATPHYLRYLRAALRHLHDDYFFRWGGGGWIGWRGYLPRVCDGRGTYLQTHLPPRSRTRRDPTFGTPTAAETT
jgi:hypothetical protein